MKALFSLSVLAMFTSEVLATRVAPKTLPELVGMADHVVVGKVVSVDIITYHGEQVDDLKARTGPGRGHIIRLHIEVNADGVLRTNKVDIPKKLMIPLWGMWHYAFGTIKNSYEGKTMIFLLKGEKLERVYPAFFKRNINELEKVKQLIKSSTDKETR